MRINVNDFIAALLETGAVVHKKGKTIIATGLTLGADKEGIIVYRGRSYIHPENYGFSAKQVGKEILFDPI